MNRRRYSRRDSRWLLVTVTLAGALSLIGLAGIYGLHYAAELGCDAQDSGDPYDCFICAILYTLGIEFPVVGVVPELQLAGLAPLPELVTQTPQRTVRLTAARSPPTRLLIRF